MSEQPQDQQDQPQDAPAGSGAQGAGQTPDAGREPVQSQMTREQENAIAAKARREAEEKARVAEERARTAEAERDAYRKADEERQAAEMSEIDRAKAEAEKARQEAEQAKADKASAELASLRATMIADHAADLPLTYKQVIGGANQDELQASIEKARGEYDAMRLQLTQETVSTVKADLRNLTDDQMTQKYGEDAADLIAMRAGRPVNIGNPSNAGGAPPPAPQETNQTQALRQVREQRGAVPEAVRKRNWVEAITGKQV